jgi:hypothetical protein
VFIEASSVRDAVRRIAVTVGALEYRSTEEVVERVYNTARAAELIDEGLSEDHTLRLFETGWGSNKVIAWVEQPLFLMAAPAALMRVWAQIPARQD